jgi:hypothetical protein
MPIHEEGPSATPRGRRSIWVALCALCVGLTAVLGAYMRYANDLPPYAPPEVAMPSPNAYGDYTVAGALIPKAQIPRKDASLLSDAELRRFVAASRPGLARLRVGLGKDCRATPLRSFSQLLPELATFRALGIALHAEGRLREREGRWADAARVYGEAIRFGAEITRGGGLIHGVIGIGIQRTGIQQLQAMVEGLDHDAAARLGAEMARAESRQPALADLLLEEKLFEEAGLMELLRDPRMASQLLGANDGSEGPAQEYFQRVSFSLAPKRKMLGEYLDYMDALVARAKTPWPLRGSEPEAPDSLFGRLLAPAMNIEMELQQRDAQIAILQVRLAERAYRMRRRSPAPTLEALVPQYLTAVPQDPFGNGPLLYRAKAGGAVVYSRGPDGDDDGGNRIVGDAVGPLSQGDLFASMPRAEKKNGRSP